MFPTTISCGDLNGRLPYPLNMTNKHTRFDIKIQGNLDPEWQDWFDDLNIIPTDEGDTILSGVIVDQAALHGVLKKINNLGLILISVNPQS